jgi:hypothetical protein
MADMKPPVSIIFSETPKVGGKVVAMKNCGKEVGE